MNSQLKEILIQDYKMVHQIGFKKMQFLYPEFKLVCLYRKAKFYINSKNILLKFFWKYKWLKIRDKKLCQISLDADIGYGFRLLHDGCRIIVKGTKIGKSCIVGVNVIIGYILNNEKKDGVPTIGNNVYIGHNSTIVGKINIGDNVLISPNSFVNSDVPSNSIVIGNSRNIKHKENASKPYMNL